MVFTEMFPIYLDVFIFTQISMKKLLDRAQMLLIYSNVFNFTQTLHEVF